jgi:hypothetical protein
MLFLSGDSPQSASSNLSGEGFDEVQPGQSPFVVSGACQLPPRLVHCRNGIKHHGLQLGHTCAHAAQRQRVHLQSRHQNQRVATDHHDERFARTQCAVTGPEDLPTVHEQHRGNTAAHVVKRASDAEKMARLQGIGSVPPLVKGNV